MSGPNHTHCSYPWGPAWICPIVIQALAWSVFRLGAEKGVYAFHQLQYGKKGFR